MKYALKNLELAAVMLMVGCGGGGSSSAPPADINPPPVSNNVPVADGGLDQVAIQGSVVTLYGGRSADADGDSLTFDWSLIERPADSFATIGGAGKTVTINVDELGAYVIDLSVNDGVDDSPVDRVTIDVILSRSLLADGTANGMWPNYLGNLSGNKYSPLDQINENNVADLHVVWRWRSPDNDLTAFQNSAFEATPLMIDGVLYASTSFSQVVAIDAVTGETLWIHDPQSYNYGRPPNNGFLHRGVAYAEHDGVKTIYLATGDARLIALNAVSGEPLETFGSLGNGSVDLLEDVPRLNASTTPLDDVHDQPDIPDLAGVVTQVG
ncbi:MAG: hypothetical protein O7E57_08105, partial [Gammaproteobacteria bacterium]|nr:hypothetical protein [Gammaproteobacteria bacterium]